VLLSITTAVECLACGTPRVRVEGDECPRCAYVGWAPSADLTEDERRAFRERAPEKRTPRRPLFAA